MNRNDFLRMIENHGPSDRQMIGEVNDLINIFPYFQSAYLLLLKGLQNTADVKFENQLRISAIRIADREVLYYLLKKEPSAIADQETSVVQQVTPETSVVQQVTPETSVAQQVTPETSVAQQVAPETSEVQQVAPETDSEVSQQVVIETAKNSEDLINEIERNADNGKSEDQADDLQNGHTILVTAEEDEYETNSIILVVDEESGSVEEKIIYMDPGFSVPDHIDLIELDLENKSHATEEEAKEETKEEAKQDNTEETSEKQRRTELIDKFIQANPRIDPVKERSDTPVEDISKTFVEGDGGFISETLARIYIRQGYYSKAINVYEKLCLKFPEKCSYFASQIEKVNELIKK